MKGKLVWLLLALLLLVQVGYGNSVEKARRVAGVAASDKLLKKEEIWNPLVGDARQYVGPLDAQTSERFRVGSVIPSQIASEKDLWRTLNGMHRVLEGKREIRLAGGVSERKLKNWLRDFNNTLTMMAVAWRNDEGLYLYVYYLTEARILAAFLNPEMETKLNNEEKKVLKGCCNWISENIRKGMPNLLKIRMVNDAVIDNTEYKLSCGKTADVVLKGLGKCAAYTTTTQLLLHMLGIDNRYVHGDVTTAAMSHAWNLVDVNGEWYHMDTTWNDPDGYSYFLLNDEEMGIDHSWPSKEDKLGLRYPEGPELNQYHFFTRSDYSDRKKPEKEPLFPVDTECTTPGEIWKQLTSGYEHEAAVLTDNDDTSEEKDIPSLPPLLQPDKTKEEDTAQKVGNAYTVADEQELDKALQTCASTLEGPEIRLQLKDNTTLYHFRYWLKKCHIHSHIRAYSYTSSSKKPTDKNPLITLKVEYWPHVRLISAAKNDDAYKQLTSDERVALVECQEIAKIYGAKWMLRRQKIDNVYLHVLNNVEWKPGESTVLSALRKRESGSLGMAETLHVVFSLLKIKSLMVHGRTDKELQAWNMVQHLGKRWYHAVVAQDAEARTRHRHVTKWNRCGDERMRKTHVWYEDEVPEAAPPEPDVSEAVQTLEKKTGQKINFPRIK